MTREEEIQREADSRWLHGSANNQQFVEACKWADQNPRKGLWDVEKVIKFIKDNVREYHKSGVFHIDDFINDLRKSMEEK